MSTVVLQTAGAFVGSLFGPIGSAIGSALGAMAGYAIDRSLLEGTRRIEGPRLNTMRPFAAEEGVAIPRVYGTARMGGNIIWATRFEEASRTERQGGKGGGGGGSTVTTYSYFANVAFALCEGRIGRVRRIWADGRELDLEEMQFRVYRGTEDQPVDPLIAARQGRDNAPAYRGVAYVVIERFPLGDYGNRIPQFQFEVLRPVGSLNHRIKSVALLPGSTEYGLSPRPLALAGRPGVTQSINRNMLHGRSDLVASLDELQAVCPDLEEIAVVVSWFGDDLRAGSCRLRPKVVNNNPAGWAQDWRVSGLVRENAQRISITDRTSNFGGTPSDRSVVECIAEIRRRGLRVALYPFLMMDIAPENTLQNPYGGASQPSFPWRGRITCMPAPGEDGSADKTGAARTQVGAFCGSASTANFHITNGEVGFSGSSADWGYRRFVLHYAHLARAAGGVDLFLLGSEMRGLTTLRDEADAFPFVEALGQLAGEVRTVIGPATDITYGADWSEYFGHQPADGSGDVFFHLDSLWAHPAVTSVGIDNYMPLADWRDQDYAGGNPDGFLGPCDQQALRAQIAAGEGFDWYYADMAARQARIRSPITDGAAAKPWVYRYKDIVAWWSNPHFNRTGGVEAGSPTAWQPKSKPVRFTELGCPAVDKGPNQPNVFPDTKSSENAAPYFSSGGRSDLAQARFIQAHFDHWDPTSPCFEETANPLSPVYGGRMVQTAHICIWAWDARPFPAFPVATQTWRDGENWHRGHWLNGRLSGMLTGDLFRAILNDHGLVGIDETQTGDSIAGYVVDAPMTARAALEPLAGLCGITVRDDNGHLILRDEVAPGAAVIQLDELVLGENNVTVERSRGQGRDIPAGIEIAFVDPFRDYQAAVARVAPPDAASTASEAISFAGSLETGAAEALLSDWLQRRRSARETASFAVPASRIDIVPGAVVSLPGEAGAREYLVTEVETGMTRQVSARRIARGVPTPWRSGQMITTPQQPLLLGMPHVMMLDLPMLPGAQAAHEQFKVAAFARPWRSQAVYSSAEETGYVHVATVPVEATLGEVLSATQGQFEGRIDHAGRIVVELYHGEISSASAVALLNGANSAAIQADNGQWEIIQFGAAEEIMPSVWELTRLLRGQLGTGDALMAGISPGAPFAVLDGAIVKAGLLPEQVGLELNWRVGPVGREFGSPSFAELQAIGGVRALLPLSPVHLRLSHETGGDALLSWVRRGRIDADSWLGEEIPLGEESERYRVTIAKQDGTVLRVTETFEPHWTYTAAQQMQDFPVQPATIAVTVRQISIAAGEGLPARKLFTLG